MNPSLRKPILTAILGLVVLLLAAADGPGPMYFPLVLRGVAENNPDPKVSVAPAAVSGAVGEPLTVRIVADNIPSYEAATRTGGVQGWQISLAFDPAILQADENADFFAGNLYAGSNAFPVFSVDNEAGLVTLGQSLLGLQSDYPAGDGLLLATIEWRGSSPGQSALDLRDSLILKRLFPSPLRYAPLAERDGQASVY